MRVAAPLLHTLATALGALKAASRGIPLAAALQVLSPDLRSRRHPVKISAPLRLCVKRFLTQNAERRTLNSEVKNSLPITHAQSYPRVRQGLSHRDRRTEIVGQIRPFPRGIIGHDPTRGQRPRGIKRRGERAGTTGDHVLLETREMLWIFDVQRERRQIQITRHMQRVRLALGRDAHRQRAACDRRRVPRQREEKRGRSLTLDIQGLRSVFVVW